jgi:hypothetical protein
MKGSWLIENALVELGSGQLMMVFRTRVGRIFAMYSEDKGRTWSEASPLADLKNPNAKVGANSQQLVRHALRGNESLGCFDFAGRHDEAAAERRAGNSLQRPRQSAGCEFWP